MKDKTFYKDAPKYCLYFFDLVTSDNLLNELENSKRITQEAFDLITVEKENYSYAPGKWTTKEVIRHIIDCERVYAYRAFRFSRFDNTELAGFDETKYVDRVKNAHQPLADLIHEYFAVRSATISLFKTMNNEMLDYKGIANNEDFTPRQLGFMTVGHNMHHCNFLKANYLGLK